jgi:hypothetical protein
VEQLIKTAQTLEALSVTASEIPPGKTKAFCGAAVAVACPEDPGRTPSPVLWAGAFGDSWKSTRRNLWPHGKNVPSQHAGWTSNRGGR